MLDFCSTMVMFDNDIENCKDISFGICVLVIVGFAPRCSIPQYFFSSYVSLLKFLNNIW